MAIKTENKGNGSINILMGIKIRFMLITTLFAIKWALLTYFGHYHGHEKKINNVNGPICFHL